MRPGVRSFAVVALVVLFCPAAQAAAQSRAWSLHAAAATYVLPADDDYVQPTVTADRGRLHFESRYNYEGRDSVSFFAGWNFAAGDAVTLDVTPMFGAVVGSTDGVIPAVSLALAFRRLEISSEAEFVIDLADTTDHFFYNWSEFSVRARDWLRAGIVIQRTRAFEEPRDLQRGVLAGVTAGRFDATAYFFNPGSDDFYFVASVGVSF